MAIGKIGRYIGSSLVGAAALAAVELAPMEGDAATVLWNTTPLESNFSNLEQVLVPDENPSYISNQPKGVARYGGGGSVSDGIIIFYDKNPVNRRVVGVYVLDPKNPGWYDLENGVNGLLADLPGTPSVEGWLPGDECGVLYKAPNGEICDASFDRPLIFNGSQQYIGNYDIFVGDPIPEPFTLALFGAGLLTIGARRWLTSK